VLAGITMNCCVETTGRDASERGFGVVLVDEATADFDDRAQHEVARRLVRVCSGRSRVVLPVAKFRLEPRRCSG
jgi:nicotinamidase-related amidase